MKKCIFVFCVCFLSACSNDSNDQITNISAKSVSLEDDYEPYISSGMQKMLSMIDTCTTAIPLEQLIPLNIKSSDGIASESDFAISRIATRSSDTALVVKGYSKISTLYSNVKTVVDATQADNFSVNAGTYYVTCKAVTYYLNSNGEIISAMLSTDVMGIDPEDLTQRGYYIDEKKAGKLYYFTTYLWGIGTSPNNISEWIPRRPFNKITTYIDDYLPLLQWRYYEL